LLYSINYIQMYKESLKGNICDQEFLIQRLNEGVIEAFEYIFKASYKALSYYALKLTGSKMAAEDIVQSVFIRLWKNKNKFDSIYSLKSFLYVSVRNGCMDENKRVTAAFNTKKTLTGRRNSFSEEELADILNAETLSILYNSIHELPPVCRRIMMMSLSGKKNSEISEKLKISVNTVRVHKQKALLKLRKILPPELQALIVIFALCEAE